MIAALQVNMTRKHAFDVAVAVCDELSKLGVSVLMSEELEEYFSCVKATFKDGMQCISECDLVISIGGDGTIIHTAEDASGFDKPILGINAGRLGFLAGLEKTELHLLGNLISSDYTVENRMRLSVRHFEGEELKGEYTCLNDIVIGRGNPLKLCEIEAKSGSRLLYNYLADGLIISTPTGSTAYSLSSGGPIVDTDIESIILTPICSHSLFSRPIIFKAETVIDFRVKNTDSCSAMFCCDGGSGIQLTESSRLVVTKSEIPTKIIRIKSENFSDILNRKLLERFNYQQGE